MFFGFGRARKSSIKSGSKLNAARLIEAINFAKIGRGIFIKGAS